MNNKLLLLINGWAGHNALLDKLMIFSAKDLIYIVFLATAAAMAYLAYKRQWREIIWFGGALVLSVGLLLVAGHLYVDHRPFMDHHLTILVKHAAGKSFPSDHTTATTAIGTGLLLLTRFKKLGVIVLAAALLIGFARIFVGVHYPVDILGGLIVGLLGGSVTFALKQLVAKDQDEHDTTSEEVQA